VLVVDDSVECGTEGVECKCGAESCDALLPWGTGGVIEMDWDAIASFWWGSEVRSRNGNECEGRKEGVRARKVERECEKRHVQVCDWGRIEGE